MPACPGCVPFEVGWGMDPWGPAQRQMRRRPDDQAPYPDTREATWWCGVAGYQPQERQKGPFVLPTH